jgi:hypothetical protein
MVGFGGDGSFLHRKIAESNYPPGFAPFFGIGSVNSQGVAVCM